jgi:hypothetical protein
VSLTWQGNTRDLRRVSFDKAVSWDSRWSEIGWATGKGVGVDAIPVPGTLVFSYLRDVIDATRSAVSRNAGTPAGTVVVRASDLLIHSGGMVTAGTRPAAGELAAFCRPVVTAPAAVRQDGTVLTNAWLPGPGAARELERHLSDK